MSLLVAILLGLIHAAVDAASVSAVFRSLPHTGAWPSAFAVVLGYDLLAFAGQAPLGWLLDALERRLPNAARGAAILGVALVAAAALGQDPLVATRHAGGLQTLLLAGAGNALFHLGGGVAVFSLEPGRPRLPGVFVAPGALGLGLGLWMGRTGQGPLWPLELALLAGAAALVLLPLPAARQERRPVEPWALLAALALLVSIAIRSLVGFAATRDLPPARLTLLGTALVGPPLAGFLGKAAGGFLAERAGWLRTSVAALLLSAAPIAFAPSAAVLLPGLLVFQMTMPVTLVALYQLLPGRPATAFGLACLALILGALPTFFPWGAPFSGSAALLGAILLSAAAVALGLRPLIRRGLAT